MIRQTPIQIEIKKDGKHFAVMAENQLVAVTVYRKGAITVEALLRGLVYYTSRKFFREALAEALVAKETETTEKPAAPKKADAHKKLSKKANPSTKPTKKPGSSPKERKAETMPPTLEDRPSELKEPSVPAITTGTTQ